jgi:hypothetical protein
MALTDGLPNKRLVRGVEIAPEDLSVGFGRVNLYVSKGWGAAIAWRDSSARGIPKSLTGLEGRAGLQAFMLNGSETRVLAADGRAAEAERFSCAFGRALMKR